MFFFSAKKSGREAMYPNIHSPFFCFSNFNLVTRTYDHLPRDCFSHCPLQSVTVWASGALQNYAQLLDYFLKDKAAFPVHPCFSYSWPIIAADANLRPKDGSHTLKMM